MLDTGSEMNIFQCFIKGIDSTIIPTIGQFCIPFNGILGSEYFLETEARLNFETKQLTVGKRRIKFKRNEKLPFELRANGISKWNKNSTNILPFIDIYNPPSNSYGQFMIDTGSEANIIKSRLLPTEIYEIYERTTTFLVVTEDFDIPCEGILGVTYLTETGAIIDYGNSTLQIGETIANLKGRKEPRTMDNQHCLIDKKEVKNTNEENTSNSVVINEIQNIPLNPIEAENKLNSTRSLDTNVSAIPQMCNDKNQFQDMDEEISEPSNENISVATDFKSMELLNSDLTLKITL